MGVAPWDMKLILVVLALWFGSAEPPKTEIETRVDRSDFPAPARRTLEDALADARDIRWYRETDGRQTGYEAKFRTRHGRYSAAFDSAGRWRDLERLIRDRELPDAVKASLNAWSESRNLRVRITRVQERWVPVAEESDARRLEALVSGESRRKDGYEIEAEVHGGRTLARYEFRVAADGTLQLVRQVVDPTSVELLY